MNDCDMRIGVGYDIHPLVAGRRLVLGGIEIAHGKGLAGHSDADALIHSICDALLGAANLGDLGDHFPETEEYRDASSTMLLERIAELVRSKGFELVNADCIIHAERPTLAPHRNSMAKSVSSLLGVPSERISIKFTKGEGMGPVGRGEAIAAQAVVLLRDFRHEEGS
jgi:2-C-methyl-D-erythritol 2,4-cyclodiphosphate synthase